MYSRAVIEAMAEEYSEAEVVAWRRTALEAVAQNLPRVEIVGMSIDGTSGNGLFVDKDPGEVVATLTEVLKLIRADGVKQANPSIMHGDFSSRQVGW